MEISGYFGQGMSVIDPSLYISYRIGKGGDDEIREIHGVVFKDNQSIGFLSYDFLRSGFQFSLNTENGLSMLEKKSIFDVFVSDIDELSQSSAVI